MEISNLSDAEFKTLAGYKDAQGASWGPPHHEKVVVRTKHNSNWNKEQFTGKQQESDEAKNQINDLGDEEAKTKQNKKSISQNNQKKKESKEMTIV